MLESIFSNMTLSSFVFLAISCFTAAFIDAIAGGGGLISLPAFMATGINPHMALGTNKLAAFFSTCGSSLKFIREKKVNWKLLKFLIPFSFLGAVLGVKTVVLIDSKYLQPIVFILLLFVLGYTLKNKSLGQTNLFNDSEINKTDLKLGMILAFILGFYDGFFGPGTGSFLIFGLIKIFKLDFISASGNSKLLNLSSNIASVATFLYFGKILYMYSFAMGGIMFIGATCGAKFAVSKGVSFIRPIFLGVTSVVLIKMVIPLIQQ